ncbi:MAG TPA: CaiB/BaiF CoA-transferase family protein [Mycobacteriales bacterium]|nr:CaiB/BaiF CoA-transferase family protein [Mycobacteriales bacterium]
MYPLLDGIRILDLTRLIPAAHVTQKLADLGADVIKVETPGAGDNLRLMPPQRNGVGTAYLQLNRNKRSLTLDVRQPEGHALFLELLATADAVVQVSTPGAFARIGLDYESLRAHKPDLVYTELSAFGQTGPWRDMPAHGYNMMAVAGNLAVEWDADGRPQLGPDDGMKREAGILWGTAALATLAALIQKLRTGRGQYIDASFWDESVAESFARAEVLDGAPSVMKTFDARNAPRYNVYATADGGVLFVGVLERPFWERFCQVVGHEEWIPRARFDLPIDNGAYDPELRDLIQDVLATRDRDDWVARFVAAGVPVSPVVTTDEELLSSEHLVAREMVATATHPVYGPVSSFRPPFRLPGTDFVVRHPPPLLGDHTADILHELGRSAAELEDLRARGIV